MDNFYNAEKGIYGVTAKGFRRKLYSEAVEERISRARRVFGVNIDTSETSFLGKLIRNYSWDEATLWELAEDVYNSAFVNAADGQDLDNVGQYLTISRRPAQRSVGILTIEGFDGTVIPKGFRVATETGKIFETVEEVTIIDKKIDVKVVSIEHGKDSNVASNTLTRVLNPIAGITSVTNIKETTGGLDTETDREFRDRYKKSYSRAGGSTVPALTSALLDIDSVIDAEVVENTTMETVNGIPPKSFECFVFGGKEGDIIDAIYRNKSAGIEAHGKIVKEVTDEKGRVHKIGYTQAESKTIYVDIKLKREENYKGDDAIKRAVINYIGGIDNDNITYKGLKLGEAVSYAKLVGAIMCGGTIKDAAVTISYDGVNYKAENIEIERNTIARTAMDKIRISYV